MARRRSRTPRQGRRDRADPRRRAAGRRTAAESASMGGRRLRQQAGALQFLEPGQVGEALEAEMIEEGLGRAIGDRPAGRAAAAAHADPAGLHQQVQRALAGCDAAHLLDFGAGRRLVIGDDGEGFERGARQRPALGLFAPQQEAKVLGGAEGPLVAAPHEIDAAAGIALGQQRRAARRRRRPRPDTAAMSVGSQRLGRGEEQRLERCAGCARRPRGARRSVRQFRLLASIGVLGLRCRFCRRRMKSGPKASVLAQLYLALPHQFKARGEGRGHGGDALLGRRRGIGRDRSVERHPVHGCRRSAAAGSRAPPAATRPCARAAS